MVFLEGVKDGIRGKVEDRRLEYGSEVDFLLWSLIWAKVHSAMLLISEGINGGNLKIRIFGKI